MQRGDAGTPVVGITMGDPGGIGPEIVVAGHEILAEHARPLVIGDATVLQRAIEVRDRPLELRRVRTPSEVTPAPEVVDVLDLANVDEHEWGTLSAAAGQASLDYVERAIDLASADEIDGIVTAPINKQAIRLAGSEHAGHTGLLADRTGTARYTMLLVDGPLRVSHVSTHVPLGRACELVTTDRVFETIQLTAIGVEDLGVADPRIAVAGLNPHAGDGGVVGRTDRSEIAPAVERARETGIDATGPASPDTVFAQAVDGAFDAVVAMYHDQGHIPVKMHGFGGDAAVSGVNVTLGLPIVRTSVDHGTAFDIAGEGVASSHSLVQAAEVAGALIASRSGRT